MQAITISIVEDLEEVREGLKNYLNLAQEFRVMDTFSNAEDAAVFLPELRPDIVIMDISLPGMTGIECIKKVKKNCPGTQFMMFTVYENDEKVFEALKAGASGYLLKKTDLPHIAAALKELHRGGSPMSANIARKLVDSLQKEEVLPNSESLTQRENEILHLLSHGLLYKEIAEKLFISVGTVSQHVHNIYEKLHVQNRTEAINKIRGKE
ncbi:MAG: DNA-binding response regulator [Bacteroidetes bacterium]|nr:MAG: DNA-binding response regulator [Bacteroidota bacterium]